MATLKITVYLKGNIGEALRIATDRLDEKNFYAFNPGFDKGCGK